MKLTSETLNIFKNIDWPCELHTNFSKINMGCKDRLSSGITWVFEHVDRAIILEDDCLANHAFFTYCKDMLDLYENDDRVYSISGSNFSNSATVFGHSFSRYSTFWGWATWANRWQKYEPNPKDWFSVVFNTWGILNPIVSIYWILIFRKLSLGKINTWDYQWMLTVWRQKGLVCRPTYNLIKNIGFRSDATHTTDKTNSLRNLYVNNELNDYKKRITYIEPNFSIEKCDTLKWAKISIRSIVVMIFVDLRNALKFKH